jgi:hypothetical protein
MRKDTVKTSHDWIFGVFDDLVAYAERQDFEALASKVLEAIEVSKQEIRMKSMIVSKRGSNGTEISEVSVTANKNARPFE